MPAPTNSEKIDGLLKTTSRLDESMDRLRSDLEEVKKDVHGFRSQLHQLETQLARIEEGMKHLKERLERSDPSDRVARIEEGIKNTTKELDKLRSNRFEIGKLILAAILGGAISFGFGAFAEFIKTRVQHQIQRTDR